MKVALIGLGMVARTHVQAIADLGGKVVLHGVLSRSTKSAQLFINSIKDDLAATPMVYDSIQAIAADPEIDFVILCTPPNARAEAVKVLAAAGKPILMEKPVERDGPAAQAIVVECENAGVPLGIVFQHRMRAASITLADLLSRGDLGEITLVEIAVPWWRPQAYYDDPGRGTYARDGGGVLISQAIHTLDLALSFIGPVTSVQAIARTTKLHNMESEDFVSAGLEFANGAVGSLMASTASFPGGAESIVLHCTKGSATLKSGQLRLAWQDGRIETIGQAGGTGGGADPMAFTHDWHKGIIGNFADALTNQRAPVPSGRDALAVHRVIDAIVMSSNQKRMVLLSEVE